MESGVCVNRLVGHQSVLCFSRPSSLVNCVVFNFDGTKVASGGIDCNIKIWDTRTSECLLTLTGHTCLKINNNVVRLKSGVISLNFSSCGNFIISAGGEGGDS